eukprot:TRINITY_DN89_c0_g1_i11.p2 TRINITY_DN89_c0_g1~~TRINITY_DN89_c0_g1_i11.p2  ORF type:complete len:118 (-),score=15.01 TRINITY_DN89_c0_g1_i11:216-569(-)
MAPIVMMTGLVTLIVVVIVYSPSTGSSGINAEYGREAIIIDDIRCPVRIQSLCPHEQCTHQFHRASYLPLVSQPLDRSLTHSSILVLNDCAVVVTQTNERGSCTRSRSKLILIRIDV